MKVLVPLDGSRLADGILAHTRRLLMREKSEIHLLRVCEPEEDQAASQAHLKECRELLEASGETIQTRIVEGEAAEQILAISEAEGFDLVTMATHGRTGLDRWIRGSVAERVLRHAEVPVLLANPQGLVSSKGGGRFQRILVPVDGSPLSAKVIPLVAPFALDSEAPLVLLHVDRPNKRDETVHFTPEVAARHSQERAERILAGEKRALEEQGLEVHVLGRYGEPASEILELIKVQDIDLVAMSSHGRTGLRRWRFGSVTEKVLRNCACPMLLRRVHKRD